MNKFLFISILLIALASTACQSVPMQTNCHTHVRFGDVLKGKPIKDSDFRINCVGKPFKHKAPRNSHALACLAFGQAKPNLCSA